MDDLCGSAKPLERHDRIATAWYRVSMVAIDSQCLLILYSTKIWTRSYVPRAGVPMCDPLHCITTSSKAGKSQANSAATLGVGVGR